ncbi:outer membrane beta barrel protein [Butyricimonas faecihominis]|nr:outer membrane beta barrel protein [Butyricimonas faecihominis]GGJ18679.1 outer membrane beta barrel protein [Butyricimonas faecihominis]
MGMKYKRLFLGICLTLLMVISQAQERVLPKFKLGGALRFNYNFCDWKPGHRDRGGDFGFDVLYFKLSGSYRNIILSADYRFYSKDFGGPMLKYGWIGYQFNDKSQMQLGLTGVPFGIQPIASHNFFLQIAYYIGLEDDSDMGIKYLYQGDTWDFTFAFFKNADELLFGSDNETSDDRYGYDVAGRNKEINQINGQAFYKFGESTRQRLGGSAEFGQLYNLDTRKNGTHYAFALHYELTTKRVSLKAQLTTYAMNPKNGEGDDDELISMTAYGAPYLVAAKANVYMLGAGYTIPVNRKFLKKIQVYNDFGWLDKQNNDYKDSFQNVTGCMLDGGPVCIYVDYALGKNHGWLGPNFNGFGTGGESDSWHARFNVNVGYYF